MARERGLTVDVAGFERLMEQQRERARKAQKKEEISVEQGELKAAPTKFVGYDFLESEAVVETVLPGKNPTNSMSLSIARLCMPRWAVRSAIGDCCTFRGMIGPKLASCA